MSGRLSGRIALVTGASRGIGHAVARALAAEGAHVLALARPRSTPELERLDDLIKAKGGTCTLIPLDLAENDSIDNLGAAIYERFGKLDILIANAGALTVLSPLNHIELKDWANVMNVNLTAQWRLIRSLDPLLRQSDAGRAVFVTSGVAQSHRPFWGAYAVSKAGLEALVGVYAAELGYDSTVKVNMVNPGATATAMRAKAMPGEDPATLPQPDDLAPLFVELSLPGCKHHGGLINYRDWAAKRG